MAELTFEDLRERYADFLLEFRDPGGNPKYRAAISQMIDRGRRSLPVDYSDLAAHPSTRELVRELLSDPEEHLKAASEALTEIVRSRMVDLDLLEEISPLVAKRRFHVRVRNLPTSVSIRDIPYVPVGQLIQLSGIVTRVSDVYDRVVVAAFTCTNPDCGYTFKMTLEEIAESGRPKVCPSCGRPGVRQNPDESEFESWQTIRIQERPEDLPPGAMPKHVDCVLVDDLVDEVKPGDRVVVTGVVQLRPARRTEVPGFGQLFKRYLVIDYVETPMRPYERVEISEEDEEKILELSRDPELEEKIIRSIAPSIYGARYIKRAIAAALFGGNRVRLPDGTRVRGEINLLLVGDPGTAKCVLGDSVVLTRSGPSRIDSLSNPSGALEGLEVASLGDGAGIGWSRASAWAASPHRGEVIRVVTESGLELSVTPTHPFLSITREGDLAFVRAVDLTRGRFLAVQAAAPPGRARLDPDLAEVLGVILLESRVERDSGRSITLRVLVNKGYVDRLRALRPDGASISSVSLRGKRARVRITLRPPKLRDRLASGPISPRSVADLLLSLDDASLEALLAGMLGAHSRLLRARGRLALYLPSAEDALLVRTLLNRMGVRLPEVRRLKRGYQILLNRRQAEKLRRGRLKLVVDPSDLRGSSDGRVPFAAPKLREVRRLLRVGLDSTPVPPATLRKYESGDTPVPADTLLALVSHYRSVLEERRASLDHLSLRRASNLLAQLETLGSAVAWDRVRELSREEFSGLVYDIEVPGSRNFVANGFIVHNSQLLKYAAQLAPRGLYTTGKGSTAAGLTAAVVRDSSTGGWTLEAGALVLADMGVACIDEFDKMSEEDRRAIHEAMEQQTISIAKAGIVATLNARTTIIAAANPKKGRYDPLLSVAENINLPPTILSRFDLIFVIRDEPKEDQDRMIADHVLGARMGVNPDIEPPIPLDLLRKYIAYARQRVRPRLSREAARVIKEYYLKMRGMSGSGEGLGPLALTARQLEALIRLSEARARMFLRDVVTEEDAMVAVELMDRMLRQVSYDVSAEALDITGMVGPFMSSTKRREEIMRMLNRMASESPDGMVSEDEFVAAAMEKLKVSREVLQRDLDMLKDSGLIYSPAVGYIAPAIRRRSER